jgi:hypothetical protein
MISYGINTPGSPCFVWAGNNPRCWNGSSTTHYDLVSGQAGAFSGAGSLTLSNGHVAFNPNPVASTNTAVVVFPSANITVPTGSQGTWSWWSYYTSSQSIDAPNFGKETGSAWDGIGGFVFGTGWATDGIRLGIGGVGYTPTYYQAYNTWQQFTFTYVQNGGLLQYLNGVLVTTNVAANVPIGSSTAPLIIGGTNNRGGNWRGYMDIIQMWPRALTADEVAHNFNAQRGRYGL